MSHLVRHTYETGQRSYVVSSFKQPTQAGQYGDGAEDEGKRIVGQP